MPVECLGGDSLTVLVGGPHGVLSDLTGREPRKIVGSLETIRGLARQDDLVWIAGRTIHPDEGVPIEHSTALRRADFMMGRRADRAGTSCAPGYLTAVDFTTGESRYSGSMSADRPVEAFVRGGPVYFLS